MARQRSLEFTPANAYRLVHAESDGLPGLIVDRYADTLVMQCLSCGIERWREVLADLLMELTGANGIYERSDVEVRALEGLPERNNILRGTVPEALLEIRRATYAITLMCAGVIRPDFTWINAPTGKRSGSWLKIAMCWTVLPIPEVSASRRSPGARAR